MNLGAGLYELRIEIPQWLEATADGYRWHADAALAADTGRQFWAYVTTGPLTILTVINLVLGWRSRGTIRRWWVAAAVVAALDRVFTFAYFIPTMVLLMYDDTLDPIRAVDLALLWARLDWARQALTLAALLLALRALTLLDSTRPAHNGESQPPARAQHS